MNVVLGVEFVEYGGSCLTVFGEVWGFLVGRMFCCRKEKIVFFCVILFWAGRIREINFIYFFIILRNKIIFRKDFDFFIV